MAYALIHATTRALYSQMLSAPVWNTLIHAPDFDTLLSELTKTVYGPYLQLDRQLLTPRRVVYQVKCHLAHIYTKLIRIAPDPAKQLLRQLWLVYEVDNLKAALRGIETGASWEQVLFLLSPIPSHASLSAADMETMVRAGDVVRAVERLKNTRYYDTLAHALERYQTEHNLFPLEVALDLDYRRELWQSIQQLSDEDRKYALQIVGTALNVDNLLWALRYRLYHHLSEEEIINYTLPLGSQITSDHIRAIAVGENLGEVVAQIYPKLPAQILNALNTGAEGLRTLELALQRHIVKICRSVFIGYPFHIGIPLAYLQLNTHEIRDLITVIEAKASQMPASTFVPLLELYPLLSEDGVNPADMNN